MANYPIKNWHETSISHRCFYGTCFSCERGDLTATIYYEDKPDDINQFATDVAEFAAWHRGEVWGELNGFSGYDNIKFLPLKGMVAPESDL